MTTSARAHLCEVNAQALALVPFTACSLVTAMSMRDVTCSVNERRSSNALCVSSGNSSEGDAQLSLTNGDTLRIMPS